MRVHDIECTGPTDAELVAEILAGGERGFERLHHLYAHRISRFVASRIRERGEIDDVVQDVLLQVHRSIGSYEGRSSLLSWIFGIAQRVIFQRYRHKRVVTLPLEACEGKFEPRLDAHTERRVDARRALRTCAEVLEHDVSSRQREIFNLYYGKRKRTRAIAAEVGGSNCSVKASLHRTRRTMEKRLASGGR